MEARSQNELLGTHGGDKADPGLYDTHARVASLLLYSALHPRCSEILAHISASALDTASPGILAPCS